MTTKIKNKKPFIEKGIMPMTNDLEDLLKISNLLRIDIIEMLYKIGIEYKGHPGPALSIADIVACLYFKLLNIDPKNPAWPDRDRLILSKGHACPAIYAALAMRGYFDKSNLYTFRHIDSILQGHPDMKKTPGIDMTAGSLGNGLGAGLGMALAGKLDKKKYKTYIILGDGEMLTIEEHNIIGGLYSAVSEVLCESYPRQIYSIAVPDKFTESGLLYDLLKKYKLDYKSIINKILEINK